MNGRLCCVLALCVAFAAPAAGQAVQEPTAPEPPPPIFELVPEAYIQLDWRSYPDSIGAHCKPLMVATVRILGRAQAEVLVSTCRKTMTSFVFISTFNARRHGGPRPRA